MSLRGLNRRGTAEKPDSWARGRLSSIPKPPTDAWWTRFAQPGQRADFIAAAKARDVERTRLADVKEGKKNQAMRHVIDPKAFPPSTRERRSASGA